MEILAEAPESLSDREDAERACRSASIHRRAPRVDGAERAPTGQAKCRSCRNPIERGSWRIRLTFFEEGRFSPGGFIHVRCHPVYFEGHDVLGAVLHFTPDLDEAGREELRRAYLEAPAPGPVPSEGGTAT